METATNNIIYQGNSTISVEALPAYSKPVVVKRPSERNASRHYLSSLEREYELTHALDGVAGVRQALGQQSIDNRSALILEYIEGETLRDLIARDALDLRSRLAIAVELAGILERIRQRRVIHLDINSQNILIGDKQRTVHLIDLGAAFRTAGSGEIKVGPEQILGTLPYISPEQTGRINRAVDERSDLYSLGVVLYELWTGQLPFDSRNPMELIHHHIARKPASPSAVSPDVPEAISSIVLKLLEKDAEDRYQSAAGVRVDIETCLERLQPDNTIESFPLGEADSATRFRYPQKLYGRDDELRVVGRAFEKACRETSSFLLVSGYTGIGKTALVEEVQRPVTKAGGYFIRGKFDQFLRTTPYTAIAQAIAGFVSQVMTLPEEMYGEWVDTIRSALGDLGRVLTDVVPEMESLIGAQPDVPQLEGREAENRLHYVFTTLLSAVATKDHPLVLFVDDLQWVDVASLKLLSVIRSEFDQPGLLVIGAYRDNEVDASHPLVAMIDDQEKRRVPLRELKLDNLHPVAVGALLSDTLRAKQGVEDLSGAFYGRTQGNPFFLRRLLSSLSEDGLIRHDSATHSWTWDIGAIGAKAPADNVADLLVNTIARLPAADKDVLQLAACLGNRFDVATLALVAGRAKQEVKESLRAAVTGQYVTEHDGAYEFVHDQVQQASYRLFDEASRAGRHLEIGRLLLADTAAAEFEERIFEIVTHYNQGAHLLTEPAERLELVRLNLVAGRRAKLAAAFAASVVYLRQGLTLLGQGAWRDHYSLRLDVHSELIRVSYLNVQHEEVEALFETITENAKEDVDASVAHKALIMSCVARHELGRAISLAESYLERLDVTLDSERESDLPIAELYELPQMEDEEKLVAMEILMAITTPVIFSVPERLPSVIYTMLNLISRYGNNTVSGFAYSWYATNLCLVQQYQEGNRFGQLAVDLLEKYPHPGRAAEIMNMQHAWIRHWGQSVHDQITPLKTHHQMAMQTGDIEWALYCLLNYTLLLWGSGKPLEHYIAEVEPSIVLCQSKNQQFSLQSFLMFAQSALNLTGRSPSTTQLEGKWFSEETMMSRLEGNQMLLALYGLLKMKLCYLFGDPGAAYRQTQDVLKYRGSLNPHYLYTKISLYGSLACVDGLADGGEDGERQERLERLKLFEQDLKLWADIGPMNYRHEYNLLQAEKCRVAKDHWKAVRLYELSIMGAHEGGFVQEEALANELCGRFWQECGNSRIAETYMREARDLYHEWGAAAKVSHLEDSYPQWFETQTVPAEQSHDSAEPRGAGSQPITPWQMDLEGVIEASHALSSETDLDNLLSTMLELVMSNSGAAKVVLLLRHDGDWVVQAVGDIATGTHDVLVNRRFDPADRETHVVPEPVFQYCRRSRDVLVVDDARLDQRIAADEMIQTQNIKSILCMPVLSQGELKAMLYLENRQVAGAFTHEHAAVLSHLATQFVISLENALLYEDLNRNFLQLRRSDERYELAVAGSDAGLFDWDVQSNELYCSDRLKELFGYVPDEISITMDWFWEQLHPEDSQVVRLALEKHLADRAPYVIDYRMRAKSGEYRWFHACGQALWDESGKAVRMSGSLTDINRRKQAEKALRGSRARLIKAEHVARTGFLDWNLKTNEMAWSEGVHELYGIDPGTPVTVEQTVALIHADDREFVNENLQLAVKGIRDFDIDHRIVRPDGKVIWVHARADLERDEDGIPTTLMGTVVDITERKAATEELRRSEERFRHLMEQSPLGIVILTPDGKMTQVNSEWMRGWSLDELATARVLAEYNMLTDPQLEELGLLPLVEKAFAGDRVVLPPIEYSGKRAVEDMGLEDIEARNRWIRCHLYSIKDEHGAVAHVVNVIMDITDLKHAEREAREQRDALARVDRATRLGQLTGSIAHELNQPLTGILSNAQAAELMLEGDRWNRDELTKAMSEIAADTKRAGDVIRGLRELYREHKEDFSPVDVNTVIADTTNLLHSEMVMQQVEFTTECAASLPKVNGNNVQIQQVLVNLIMNGVQAMSSMPRDERLIRVATESEENEVIVWVEDRGPGIGPDKIDRVFEPLATWKPGGTGMGLALSNSIIEAHGGRMWAEDRPDGGARVGFAIPLPQ